MKDYPEPVVSAVIVNPDDQILLCRSEKWNDQYVIPGGHIEKGESMEDALHREVQEETGLDIYDVRLIGVQESIFSDTFHEERHFIFFDYVCKTDSVEVLLNDEANEYAWVEREDIMDYDLGGYTRELFTRLLHPEAFSGRKVYYNYV